MKKMSMDDRLALNMYHTDEVNPHIIVDLENYDPAELKKLLLACPAGCYTLVDGIANFSHLGCLECGTCRVLCKDTIVKEWNHPMGERGVQFRQG